MPNLLIPLPQTTSRNGSGKLPPNRANAAISLQSGNAPYHPLSCTLNAVRALYVVECTFYDGFESRSICEPSASVDGRPFWRACDSCRAAVIPSTVEQPNASETPCPSNLPVSRPGDEPESTKSAITTNAVPQLFLTKKHVCDPGVGLTI